MTRMDPTGERVALTRGDVYAEIAEVGAALRRLRVDGRELVAGYPDGMPAPGAAGVVLVPWPNRVRAGRWELDGEVQQLAISEPALSNASHGLLRYAPYAIDATAEAATLTARVFAQAGYPFTLATSVAYALTDDGVEVTHAVENVGAASAPVAIGAHPYLAAPEGAMLEVPGRTWFEVDDHKIPVGERAMTPELDFEHPRPVADIDLDTAFGDLQRDDTQIARTRVVDAAGRGAELWQDEAFAYVQVFTNRTFPGHAVAVAVEPMTAPADAFNSGIGLRLIEPGETLTARWGIRSVG